MYRRVCAWVRARVCVCACVCMCVCVKVSKQTKTEDNVESSITAVPSNSVWICRYISEDFGGVALHPIDLLDASTGKQVAQLTDPNLVHICPVNKPHPRQDIIISGSSRSLYAWKPAAQGKETLHTRHCMAHFRNCLAC